MYSQYSSSDFRFLLPMAGGTGSLLERLFSNHSKLPPDVKFVTFEGPLPAHKSLLTSSSPAMKDRDRKNLRNSEYSGFCLFGRIEWVPPLKTKKLLKVTRRTGK